MKLNINELDNFYTHSLIFTKEECNDIIQYITDLQDTVYTVRIDGKFIEDGCSLKSQDLIYDKEQVGWVFDRVIDFINQKVKLNWISNPHAIFRNYTNGSYFVKHKDNVDASKADKRYLTISIQLSESNNYEGGDVIINDTEYLPREIGSVFIWGTNVPHEVTPITSGERNSLIFFVSEKHIEPIKTLF